MKKLKKGTKFITVLAALLFASVMLTTTQVQARLTKVALTAKIKTIPPRPALYDQTIKPLKMKQCAQCHIGVFKLLKAQGHRHQKVCTFCHEVYHTYSPGRVSYKDALPKCVACHGHPHGNKPLVVNCSNCHSNAHSPLNLPNITGDMCINCHPGPPADLKKYPSKHSDLDCTDCHTKHGYIPNCTMCHSEDGGEVYHIAGNPTNKVCLSCHVSPHKPLQISYAPNTPKKLCASCHMNPTHAKVYADLKKADSKHFKLLTCAKCHVKHGKIPSCFKCHDHKGHRKNLKGSDCLRCHTDPHNPLNVTFSPTDPKSICGGCHTKEYKTLVASNTRHSKLTCTFCHPHHGELPKCQRCHGVPHGKDMLKKFGDKCGACHGTAHDVRGRMHGAPTPGSVLQPYLREYNNIVK